MSSWPAILEERNCWKVSHMLVLSRKINEEICLPDLDVRIVVLKQKGNTVRLGIAAPKEVQVLRGELAEFKMATPNEDQHASSQSPSDLDNSSTQSMAAA